MVRLNDIGVGIDQRKGALGGRQSRLDLRPERGEVEHREEKLVKAHDKEIPRSNSDNALRRAQSADVNEDGDKDAAQSIERGKNQREDKTALHIDLVGLLV